MKKSKQGWVEEVFVPSLQKGSRKLKMKEDGSN
jgi:hypothetical protein